MSRLHLIPQYQETSTLVTLMPGVPQVLSSSRCRISPKTNIEAAQILVTETATGKLFPIYYGQPSPEIIGATAVTVGPLPQIVEVVESTFDKIIEFDTTTGEVKEFSGAIGGGVGNSPSFVESNY